MPYPYRDVFSDSPEILRSTVTWRVLLFFQQPFLKQPYTCTYNLTSSCQFYGMGKYTSMNKAISLTLGHLHERVRLVSNFSIQNHPWITHYGHENKGNYHSLKKLLIVKYILLISNWRVHGEQYEEYTYWCCGIEG